ncbi:MAG TPA: ATP12 family protein [Sphingomicrobium sp.]|nr:ATP12 family protein [Sphingomicrobium sp.]
MKRFWTEVSTLAAQDGWVIRLDSRAIQTPARAPLVVPTKALAAAIAEEWRLINDEINPRAMPLTGLANAAIDRIAPDRQAFAAGLAKYGEADLACYRSEWPPELVKRQLASWDPLLEWGRRRYDVDFATTSGLLHLPQAQATIDRLGHAVAELDAFHLAGLSPLVSIGGSLIAALAVLEKAITPEAAWEAASIDEGWQLEQWGGDREAQTALENRRRDFFAGARFLDLLG